MHALSGEARSNVALVCRSVARAWCGGVCGEECRPWNSGGAPEAVLPQVRTVESVRLVSSMPHSCRSAVLEVHSNRDASVPSQSTDARPTGRLATRTCTVMQLIFLLA